MQLLIWFVNSNIQNAFSTGVIGLAYGPVFPASLTLVNDILPPDIHMVSMAIMSVIFFSHMRFFENLLSIKIDLPVLVLEPVRTVVLMFVGSNCSVLHSTFPVLGRVYIQR